MNLMLACFTLVSFLLLNTLTKGFLKAVSVLFAMILGTILAGFLGMVDTSGFIEASWFTMVTPFILGYLPSTFHPLSL